MLFWIYDIPTASLVALFAIVFVGITWAGILFVRPFFRICLGSRPGINELVGYILGSHGVFYGILLGLLSVAAYDRYNKVEINTEEESVSLASMYRLVSSYPDPIRTELQTSIRDYTRWLIDEAWPQQQKGIVPSAGTAKTSQFQKLLYSFEPDTPREEILHTEAVAQFTKLVELRRTRLLSVTKGIPAILWYVVILGAMVNIVLVWSFDMRLMGQLILGGLLSFFVSTVIAMIAAMDYPFRGQFSVTADVFEQVYQSVMKQDLESPPESEIVKPEPASQPAATSAPSSSAVPAFPANS